MLRLLGKGPWAVADQLLISATNFATMVLLARGLSGTSPGLWREICEECFVGGTLCHLHLLLVRVDVGLRIQRHRLVGLSPTRMTQE